MTDLLGLTPSVEKGYWLLTLRFQHVANVQEADCKRMVDAAVETFGGLHMAFNNAGTIEKGTFAEITDEVASKMIDVNFKSLVFCFKYQVLPARNLRASYALQRLCDRVSFSSPTVCLKLITRV